MMIKDFNIAKVDNGYTIRVQGQKDPDNYMTQFYTTLIAPDIETVKKFVDEYLV